LDAEIVPSTLFDNRRDEFGPPELSGFVRTAVYAHLHRHELSIRPDDVWLAITSQFCRYLRGNSESVADYFLDLQGRDGITVVEEPQRTIKLVWQIAVYVRDSTIRDWLLPDFTTTTDDDRLAAVACLMPAPTESGETSLLFVASNEGESSFGGIPSVEILGNAEDWELVARRAKCLRDFELPGSRLMESWTSRLQPILERFARQKRTGTPDVRWWNAMCVIRGSPVILEGWLSAFCAFAPNGRWQILDHRRVKHLCSDGVELQNLPDGRCAFVATEVRNGDNRACVVATGLFGMKKDPFGLRMNAGHRRGGFHRGRFANRTSLVSKKPNRVSVRTTELFDPLVASTNDWVSSGCELTG
jgi:hypothetical protein